MLTSAIDREVPQEDPAADPVGGISATPTARVWGGRGRSVTARTSRPITRWARVTRPVRSRGEGGIG